ncbi:MAG: hypothetical protein FJY07_08420, partial [Bacteroidetes bacterium]|nr:hypothetical protein [Bacteroidota bacterium]
MAKINIFANRQKKSDGVEYLIIHLKSIYNIFAEFVININNLKSRIMYGKMKDYLASELKNIQEAGLYKHERIK